MVLWGLGTRAEWVCLFRPCSIPTGDELLHLKVIISHPVHDAQWFWEDPCVVLGPFGESVCSPTPCAFEHDLQLCLVVFIPFFLSTYFYFIGVSPVCLSV